MTVKQPEEKLILSDKTSLFADYSWYYSNFYLETKKAIEEFFQKEFNVRFMGIAGADNVLFYGDEYFVNKVPVTKNGDFKIKLSSSVVSCLLDTALGSAERKFELKKLSDIEAMLIKSFTVFLYKKLEKNFNKNEVSKKVLQNAQERSFNFFLQSDKKHIGKIIVTVPDFLIGDVFQEERKAEFKIDDFQQANVKVKVCVGKSKVTLNEIKLIEDGDIIVLENSDISTMSVLWKENEYSFKINPNPSLIISVDNSGGNEMEEDTNVKSSNMWDSILVDIVAEFDNVKLTLGELKQISEGLVIDVGSVYDNKIKLRVENQVVATGELVILNDRYGVRIDSVKKSKETAKQPSAKPAAKPTAEKAAAPAPKKPAKPAAKAANQAEGGDENFDYSDFEIEDESI